MIDISKESLEGSDAADGDIEIDGAYEERKNQLPEGSLYFA